MTAQTGSRSTSVFGTIIDSVEIPTTNLGFSTVVGSKKMPLNDSDNDEQPEVATWSPKPDTQATL